MVINIFEQPIQNPAETRKISSLSQISPDISSVSPEERKAIFEKLAESQDENWAFSALDIDQPFSAEEVELMVSIITDPYISSCALMSDTANPNNGERLTQSQREKLMTQVLSDKDVMESFYSILEDSGITEDPNKTEKWWLECLIKKNK